MRDLFRSGLRLGESLARLPWKVTRRLASGKSETLNQAADLGERLGTLPFRAAARLVERSGEERAPQRGPRGEQKAGRGSQSEARSTGEAPAGAKSKGRILVVGAGYGGLTAFLELQDHLGRQYDLVLVNSDKHHWFTTELHTYVAGTTEDAVRIPLKRIIHPPGRLIVDRVVAIHPKERQVELKVGGRLSYHLLVFALGSDPEYYGLPGVQEHSLAVGSWQAATKLRQRIQQLLEATVDDGPTARVVVAGGGLTGVEVAGELADEYPGRLRLTILEAAPEIMGGFDPELVQVSRTVLEAKGIRILTGTPITRVDDQAIHLKSGEEVEYDLLVWSGGVRGSSVLADSGLELTARGRATVDPYLRSVTDDRVYLVGDSASFLDPESGREIPPTAQAAVQMGRLAGRNILRRLRGRPEVAFTFRKRGSFASLGKHEGVGQIGQEHFAGLPAMMVKHLIEGHHAWEMGSGVMPLVRRLLSVPRNYLTRRGAYRPQSRAGTAENPPLR